MSLPNNFITTFIPGTACIGDSRQTINTNFSTLLCGVSSVWSYVDTVSSSLSGITRSISTTTFGPATTVTTLVSALSVFNVSGTYLGYIPIYK